MCGFLVVAGAIGLGFWSCDGAGLPWNVDDSDEMREDETTTGDETGTVSLSLTDAPIADA